MKAHRSLQALVSASFRLAASILLALLLTTALDGLLGDSVEPSGWDPETSHSWQLPGSVHRHRSEGWAMSRFGAHGLYGPFASTPTSEAPPTVLIWGNSHAAGWSVADEEKIASRAQGRWSLAEGPPLRFLTVGVQGSDIATIHALLPRYESLLETVYLHVVLVDSMDFLTPKASGPGHRLDPEPAWIHPPDQAPNPRLQKLVAGLRSTRTTWLLRLAKDVRDLEPRFHLGRVGRVTPSEVSAQRAEPSSPSLIAAWRFLLESVLDQAEAPVLFLFAPQVPSRTGDELVLQAAGADSWTRFSALCIEQEIECHSLEGQFAAFFLEHGRATRGFSNSHPFEGHLNADGLDLVAEHLVQTLAASPSHALHAD